MKRASKTPETEVKWSHSDAAMLIEIMEKMDPETDSDWNEVAKKLSGSVPRTGASCKKFFTEFCKKEFKEKSHWKEIQDRAIQFAQSKQSTDSDDDGAAEKHDSTSEKDAAGEELVYPSKSTPEEPKKSTTSAEETPKKRKRRTKKEMEEFRKEQEEKKKHRKDESSSKKSAEKASSPSPSPSPEPEPVQEPKPVHESEPVHTEPEKKNRDSDFDDEAPPAAEPKKRKAGRPPRSTPKTKPVETATVKPVEKTPAATEVVEEPQKKKRREIETEEKDAADNAKVCEKLDTLTEMMKKLIDVVANSVQPTHKHLFEEQPDGSSFKCTVCGFVRKL